MDCLHVPTTEAVFAPRLLAFCETTRNVFDPEEELIDELPSPPAARRRLGQPLNGFDIGFLEGGEVSLSRGWRDDQPGSIGSVLFRKREADSMFRFESLG
jgi:hypothetical protein